MTVNELIEELRKYPGDMPVVSDIGDDKFTNAAPEEMIMLYDKMGEIYSLTDGDGIRVLVIF